MPAAGAKAALAGTAFDRVVDGKIAEHWADVDLGTFLQQLSAAPATLASQESDKVERPWVGHPAGAERS